MDWRRFSNPAWTPPASGPLRPWTDADVLYAVAGVKKEYKRRETIAASKLRQAREKAYSWRADDDVGQAARHNFIRRAEVGYEDEMQANRERRRQRLDWIREHAGTWADLVPSGS